jgi:hypothetical protein
MDYSIIEDNLFVKDKDNKWNIAGKKTSKAIILSFNLDDICRRLWKHVFQSLHLEIKSIDSDNNNTPKYGIYYLINFVN